MHSLIPTPPPGQGVAGPVVVVIMDGIGIGPTDAANAVAQAQTPHLDRFRRESLYTQLQAHGRAVGMPSDADMGNSEVGHNAMGAGRIFEQGALLVNRAFETGEVFQGLPWQELMQPCAHGPGTFHVIGLLSDGNVHSHIEHLLALIARADSQGVRSLCVHALLDGRDVPHTSALTYVDQLEAFLAPIRAKPHRHYRIASGGGRMQVTMDRYEADWSMVERGWYLHVKGQGRGFSSARQAIETFRAEHPGLSDQDLPGFVIYENNQPTGPIRDGDGVLIFNFRGDRVLELVRAFEDEAFDRFPRGPRPQVLFAGMTLYDGDTHRPHRYLVEPPHIEGTWGELLCHAGVTQLACSETQKFGHVTYFWNGNRSGMFDAKLERYIEIPSRAPPFDAHPEMQAAAITETVLRSLAQNQTRLSRINFANGDMVGHTGHFDATVAAVEAVDQQLGQLERAVLGWGGALMVTADHGNADDMAQRDPRTGAILRTSSGRMVPKTSHSLNPVPLYIVLSPQDKKRFRLAPVHEPGLGHIAATGLVLLGFKPPPHFLPPVVVPAETALLSHKVLQG